MHPLFPRAGISAEAALTEIHQMLGSDLKRDGRAFAFVYAAGEELEALTRAAFSAGISINGLDPTAYPSARLLENGVVGACLELLNAPKGAVGTATSGGTESLILALKSARDYTRRTKPEIKTPKLLLAETAHASLHKAAHYLGVEVVQAAVDPSTLRADLADFEQKLCDDTILAVGSAPSYAHGVIDPIEELSELARGRDILFHVDACVGGWVLPFLESLGYPLPAFDFRLPGVTSVSVDLHKYGYAPKGVSVLLQRNKELRLAQYFACARWTGYPVVNSSILGSKSVAALAAAHALIRHLGRDGYAGQAERMWRATQTLKAGLLAMPGVELVAIPDANLIAFKTIDGDLFELADELSAQGWHVQVTYAYGQSPAHIHLTIDPGNAARVDEFLGSLANCVPRLPNTLETPPVVLALLNQASSDSSFDASLALNQLGVTEGQLPQRAAFIHRLLNAASPSLREHLLCLFFDQLFQPSSFEA